jgi:hypothetical protein
MHKSDTQVTKMESQSKMMLKYKDLVEEGKKQFQKEKVMFNNLTTKE